MTQESTRLRGRVRWGWLPSLALICVLSALAPQAGAQQTPPAYTHGLTAQQRAQLQADRKEVLNYPVNQKLIDRLRKLAKIAADEHLKSAPSGNSATTFASATTAGQARELSKRPRVVVALAESGFTPHEFVVAMKSLYSTLFTAQMMEHPNSPMMKWMKSHNRDSMISHYNHANLAFYKAHRKEVDALMQSMKQQDAQ